MASNLYKLELSLEQFPDSRAQNNRRTIVIPEYNHSANWPEFAECKDKGHQIFYSSVESNTTLAKAICAECIVRTECLEFAIETKEDHGIWGGESARAHRGIIKRRKTNTK